VNDSNALRLGAETPDGSAHPNTVIEMLDHSKENNMLENPVAVYAESYSSSSLYTTSVKKLIARFGEFFTLKRIGRIIAFSLAALSILYGLSAGVFVALIPYLAMGVE
jgi:hypothetical protein